jgi:Co/Zn/Cd efflux system component
MMFIAVMSCCALYGSSALLADSLDNLGDALSYGLSLYAVACGAAVSARLALFNGVLILFAALLVAAQIIYRLFVPGRPVFELMGVFSLLGLVANSVCLYLL